MRRMLTSRTYNDAGCPGVEQKNRTNQEGAGQHHANRQQEPVSEANVLLPEEEGVSVWVVEHTLPAKLITDGPHTFDGFHKVAGLAKAIQIEGELSKLQGLCCWDCKSVLISLYSIWFSGFSMFIISCETLTAQIFPCSVILVVDPLSWMRVEVGLGGSITKRIVTDPDCQVNVEHLWGDQTLCINQPTRSQLEKNKKQNEHLFISELCNAFWCNSSFQTYLTVVKRLLLGGGLDEKLVRQSSILCAVAVAVSSNPACLPVNIKSSLKTWVTTQGRRKIIMAVIYNGFLLS